MELDQLDVGFVRRFAEYTFLQTQAAACAAELDHVVVVQRHDRVRSERAKPPQQRNDPADSSRVMNDALALDDAFNLIMNPLERTRRSKQRAGRVRIEPAVERVVDPLEYLLEPRSRPKAILQISTNGTKRRDCGTVRGLRQPAEVGLDDIDELIGERNVRVLRSACSEQQKTPVEMQGPIANGAHLS
ncbi:MAG TPA: hypothetical protein VGC72_16545 [Candidatus Elarobacter sp.]